MKTNHKNIAAKANLIFNLFLDADIQPIEEAKVNSAKTTYGFHDFSFDYKKIKELKALREMRK